ncbi:MAG: hypothetical protein Q8P95_05360, partial [bacterium]|nr:hypothetical protein [bacterium]
MPQAESPLSLTVWPVYALRLRSVPSGEQTKPRDSNARGKKDGITVKTPVPSYPKAIKMLRDVEGRVFLYFT